MRTPLRLAAKLAKFRLTQVVRGRSGQSALYRVELRFGEGKLVLQSDRVPTAALFATGGPSPRVRNGKKLSALAPTNPEMPWAKSPSLWLTGPAELLGFSGIPGLARVLQDPRRTVFLETDGMKLRRRIHEFRPNARLYLTVPLYGLAATRNARMQKEGAFSQAMEGIRAAHLSGFLICAHVVIESATDLGEIAQLLELLRAMKIDGVVITAPEDSSDIDGQKLRAARSLLGNSWWAKFSRLARQSLHGPRERAAGFAGAPGAEVATP